MIDLDAALADIRSLSAREAEAVRLGLLARAPFAIPVAESERMDAQDVAIRIHRDLVSWFNDRDTPIGSLRSRLTQEECDASEDLATAELWGLYEAIDMEVEA